jgi:hypothetical protein
VPRDNRSWPLSGAVPADEMAEQPGFPLPAKRDCQTVAGFVLAELRRIPAVGESMEAQGWRFEMVDLDGRRIDKVMASRIPPAGGRSGRDGMGQTPEGRASGQPIGSRRCPGAEHASKDGSYPGN